MGGEMKDTLNTVQRVKWLCAGWVHGVCGNISPPLVHEWSCLQVKYACPCVVVVLVTGCVDEIHEADMRSAVVYTVKNEVCTWCSMPHVPVPGSLQLRLLPLQMHHVWKSITADTAQPSVMLITHSCWVCIVCLRAWIQSWAPLCYEFSGRKFWKMLSMSLSLKSCRQSRLT